MVLSCPSVSHKICLLYMNYPGTFSHRTVPLETNNTTQAAWVTLKEANKWNIHKGIKNHWGAIPWKNAMESSWIDSLLFNKMDC